MPAKGNALQRQLELFKIFKMAIKAEQRAQQMYQAALSRCDDAEIRSIIASLRDDEIRHEKEIKEIYRQLKKVIAMGESSVSSPRRATPAKTKKKGARK